MSKYRMLHDRGVRLADDGIDYIVSRLEQGILDACGFLNQPRPDSFKLISSDNLNRIGFAPEAKALNIPVAYLNNLADARVPLENIEIDVSVSNWKMTIGYSRYLVLAGREEIIHFFQYVNHPYFHAQIDGDYANLPKMYQSCCEWEVEARKTVDQICIQCDEKPAWRDFDEQLALLYPNLYNQSIGFLSEYINNARQPL